jgi:hypothetical protein
MYLDHFGLARKPFSKTPDPEFLFHSRQHAEALARLSHALDEREVAVLTGEVGTGKTTLSRALVDAFAERCRFSLVIHPALPPAQLLGAVAEGFGLSPGRRKGDVFAAEEALQRAEIALKLQVLDSADDPLWDREIETDELAVAAPAPLEPRAAIACAPRSTWWRATTCAAWRGRRTTACSCRSPASR